MSAVSYPVRLDGRRDPQLSRWLWLVKWLLVIPHAIVLAFLWAAFALSSIGAFVAILFTGRYPRSIFDFNLGVLRWSWRVAFYSYSALGTDRYPPFSLGEEPGYPAQLHVAYPEHLSRGLVLVKWWLLALPHYLILAVFVGGGTWLVGQTDEFTWHGGLVGLLVLFAGLALLFTGRYPVGLFDLILGMNRWVVRVAAYAGLMTDAYPPFRLDTGAVDPATVTVEAPAAPPARPHTGLAIGAGLLALLAAGLVLAGGGVLWLDQTQRDPDGFVMSNTERYTTPTYALASERIHTVVDGPGILDATDLLGTVRVRSRSDQPTFVGIAPHRDALAYLAATEHEVIGDLSHPGRDRDFRDGREPRSAPTQAGIWVASSTGSGEQTLEWDVPEGDWTVVVMNADGSRGVSAEMAVGAELDGLGWLAGALLGAAAVLALGAAGLLAAALRKGP